MPLVAYFSTVGAALVALLLFVNFLLEPPHPTKAKPDAEANPPNSEISRPVSRQTVGVTRTAPSAPDPYALPPRDLPPLTAAQIEQTDPMASSSALPATEPKSSRDTKPRRRSAHIRARTPNSDDPWRFLSRQPAAAPAYTASAYSDTRYDSRAGLRSRWSSSAQGTLGPH